MHGALPRLGFDGVTVRQGKRFELEIEGELTETARPGARIAARLCSRTR